MKKRIIGIIMLTGIFAATAVVSNAQIVRQLKTTVPFSFNVGNTELPAGKYVIVYGATSLMQNTIAVRSSDGSNKALALVTTEIVTLPKQTNGVAFKRANGRYYLGGVSLYALKIDLASPRSDVPGLKIAAK